jgi:hypothetical protein
MLRWIVIALLFVGGAAFAHQQTPTYPELKLSHLQNVLKAEMRIFNKREDVQYYAIKVYDEDFLPVPFAARERILNVKPFETKNFDVYIRVNDAERAVYICTESKILKADATETSVTSRICSKIK